jgi:hypothetical protein
VRTLGSPTLIEQPTMHSGSRHAHVLGTVRGFVVEDVLRILARSTLPTRCYPLSLTHARLTPIDAVR